MQDSSSYRPLHTFSAITSGTRQDTPRRGTRTDTARFATQNMEQNRTDILADIGDYTLEVGYDTFSSSFMPAVRDDLVQDVFRALSNKSKGKKPIWDSELQTWKGFKTEPRLNLAGEDKVFRPFQSLVTAIVQHASNIRNDGKKRTLKPQSSPTRAALSETQNGSYRSDINSFLVQSRAVTQAREDDRFEADIGVNGEFKKNGEERYVVREYIPSGTRI